MKGQLSPWTRTGTVLLSDEVIILGHLYPLGARNATLNPARMIQRKKRKRKRKTRNPETRMMLDQPSDPLARSDVP